MPPPDVSVFFQGFAAGAAVAVLLVLPWLRRLRRRCADCRLDRQRLEQRNEALVLQKLADASRLRRGREISNLNDTSGRAARTALWLRKWGVGA